MRYAFYIAWRNIVFYKSTTVLNILLFTIAATMISAVLLINHQAESILKNNVRNIDLVVGAKGSPMQIILSGLFHIDNPTGNIAYEEAQKFMRHPLVEKAIPLSIGDSYQNHRIVGTDTSFIRHYEMTLQSGNWFQAPFEVVVGSVVAKSSSLQIGDEFHSAHGLQGDLHTHDHKHYRVVGIAEPTHSVADFLILTSTESVWRMHDIDPTSDQLEITNLLIAYKSPAAMAQLPRQIQNETAMVAASPAKETARLLGMIGVGADVVFYLAAVFVLLAALSLFLGLLNALKNRQGELFIMRGMGASRTTVLSSIISEGVIVALLGTLPGILIGHGVVTLFGSLQEAGQIGVSGSTFLPEVLVLIPAAIGLGILVALIPGVSAYRKG